MSNLLKNAIVWIIMGASLIYLFNSIDSSGNNRRSPIDSNQFYQEVIGDRVQSLTFKEDQQTIHGIRHDGTRFEVILPYYDIDYSLYQAIRYK